MSDIYCAKCGEPWDSYGINRGNCNRGEGDVTGAESERFHKGEGCPSCGFGTRCPSCNGTGAQSDPTCPHRCGNGKLLAWSPQQNSNFRYQSGVWYFGYAPNVKEIPEGAKKLRNAEGHGSLDGWVNQRWYSCPHCIPETGPKYPCDECKGDGKLHRQNKDDLELRAAESAIEASDEEPIGILAERGM
jgi:hypothetical protein